MKRKDFRIVLTLTLFSRCGYYSKVLTIMQLFLKIFETKKRPIFEALNSQSELNIEQRWNLFHYCSIFFLISMF